MADGWSFIDDDDDDVDDKNTVCCAAPVHYETIRNTHPAFHSIPQTPSISSSPFLFF